VSLTTGNQRRLGGFLCAMVDEAGIKDNNEFDASVGKQIFKHFAFNGINLEPAFQRPYGAPGASV
jgi:hypothetical protein